MLNHSFSSYYFKDTPRPYTTSKGQHGKHHVCYIDFFFLRNNCHFSELIKNSQVLHFMSNVK